MMASTPDNLYVTYVDVDRDLLKIWGQRNRIGATYIERQLLQLLPEFNRTQCPNPSQIHKGMFCFAKYTDDNYYRARVLSLHGDSVGVLFVDYGNRDIINLCNIRVQEGMDADVLAKMSEQAEEFYLARVAAPSIGWTKEIISEVRRDICCEEFIYHVVAQVGDRKILEIQFHSEDYSNYLVKKQLATPLSLPVQSQMILTYCRLVPSEPKPENSSREMSRLTYSPSMPPPNMRSTFRALNPPSEGMMQMSYGKPPSAMSFSQTPPPLTQHSPRRMNSPFPQLSRTIPRNPSFPSPGQMNVSGSSPQGMNPMGSTQFSPMQTVKETSDPFQGNNFIQMLAQQVKQYIAEDNAKSETETEKIPHHYVNSVLEVGNTHNVIVSFIDDGPWSFSVQPLASETELQKLMDELSTTELVHLKPPIVLGHPCIASSALYGNLCRGVVVSICRSAVKVYFVDFGNTEDLPFSSIYELPPKFFKIRVLSQKFSLSGLQKVVYSEDIKKFFKEVVQDELLMLRVMSLEDDNLPTCELYLKDKNIKRILNEKIRELRSTLDDFPKVGETENVVVTWVVSPLKFFVQLYKRDQDLYALKGELAEVPVKGQRLTYQQLSVGFKCVCLYEADGQWYRAVITSVDSENAISVFYVDYGNTETVNISMLRRIEAGGLINQMRNQAIQCSLKGFEDRSFDQSLTRKLESLVLEKELQMTVVSSEKELLCVQLFDNGKDISSMMLTSCAQALSSPFSGESSFTGSSDKAPGEKETYESKSFRNVESRLEENWRDKSKDNYWREDQNKNRGFKQSRESNVWEDNNNNSIKNTGGFSYGSKPFGQKQERGRDEWSDGGKFERSQGFRQEKSRGGWEEKKESFGERKRFDENRGGREKFDDNRDWRQRSDDNRGGREKFDDNRGGREKFEDNRGGREKFDDNRGGREKFEDNRGGREKFDDNRGGREKFDDNRGGREKFGDNRGGREKFDDNRGGREKFDDNRGGREKFDENRGGREKFDENRGGRQRFEDSRGNRDGNRSSDSRGGRGKFDGNRGGRDKFGGGDGKRFERSKDPWGEEGSGRRFVRNETSFSQREGKDEERRSTRKPIRKEDIAPPGSKFEEKILEIGSCERGIVTYYFSPHEFFVQLLSDEAEFKKMMGEIQTYYSDKYSIKDPVQAGDIVVAQFSLDKVLYRAEVVKPTPVTVRYVDYGNHEPVGPKTTYFVDKQFLRLPKQVIKCRLSNIQPVGSNWPPPGGATDKFFEFSEYKCTILSMEDDFYVITMEDIETLKDVGQELVAAGLAKPMTPKLDVPEIDISLLPNQILRLYISHVDSSSKFYVLLNPKSVEGIENELKLFADDKKKLVKLTEDSLKTGTLCLSTSDDVSWRRADIVKTDGNKILVWFCDKGDRAEVTPDKVMSLPDHLKEFQPQAVECSLHGNSLTKGEDVFKKEIEFKDLLVFIVSVARERLSVVLYNKDGKKFDFQDCEDFPQTIDPFGQSPIISQKLSIVTSHCDSLHEIYVQNLADTDDINNLAEQLNVFYSEEKEGFAVTNEEPKGTFVAAKSVVYDSWYRARLLSSSADGLEVFYIDYGNRETLPKENVRRLDSFFFVWREFCKKVALDVNFEVDKNKELIKKFYKLQTGDVFGYFVNSAGKLLCEFVVDGERLTRKFDSPGFSLKDDDKFDELFSGKKFKPEESIPEAESPPSDSEFVEPDEMRVVVSHVDSPNLFWVHREYMTGELQQLQDKLQKSCEVLPEKKNPQVGDVVGFHLDTWYRARVTQVDGNNVTVQFIDYGNTFSFDLSLNVVKELTEELLSVPVFATSYSLTGTWSENSRTAFEEVILQNEEAFKAVILDEDEPHIVDLYMHGESIAELLQKRVAEEFETKDLCKVYITHADSPSDFYIQKVTSGKTVKMLNDRLADAENFETPDFIKHKDIYAAEFPDDGAWYRATVTKIEGDNIEVFFVDYGNTSNVTDVKSLPKDLADIPILSERCSLLLGEKTDAWSEAACKKFMEYTVGQRMKMKVLGKGPEKQVVKLFFEGKNLTEELEKLCEPDGRREVYISHAVSPTEFYIQNVNDEHFSEITEKLAKKDEAEDLVDFKPGDLCQARFIDDGFWYRAKILKKLIGAWKVFFMDFGNDSVATQLKKLPAEISEIPPRAVRCSLDIPETNIPESVKEEFIKLTEGDVIFRALFVSDDDVKKVSLKINGRMVEEILNLHKYLFHKEVCSDDWDSDDGKNSENNLTSRDYVEDDLQTNETDEEKRVKFGGLEGWDEGRSDEEKSTVSSGFVNATDNELIDEARESEEKVNISAGSTLEEVDTPEVSTENIKPEVDVKASKKVEVKEISKRSTKVPYSEKVVPGSISYGIPLEVEKEDETPQTEGQTVKGDLEEELEKWDD